MQEESIDILDPNLVKPVRSLLKVKKKIHFCPQSTWYGLDGNEQTKPLSNKYTLRYSLLNFKAKFFPVYLKRHYENNWHSRSDLIVADSPRAMFIQWAIPRQTQRRRKIDGATEVYCISMTFPVITTTKKSTTNDLNVNKFSRKMDLQ